jgi:hypothetical protein
MSSTSRSATMAAIARVNSPYTTAPTTCLQPRPRVQAFLGPCVLRMCLCMYVCASVRLCIRVCVHCFYVFACLCVSVISQGGAHLGRVDREARGVEDGLHVVGEKQCVIAQQPQCMRQVPLGLHSTDRETEREAEGGTRANVLLKGRTYM